MQYIKVGRYERPQEVGFLGWLEPEDRSWILFVDLRNRVRAFIDRDPETGGCK